MMMEFITLSPINKSLSLKQRPVGGKRQGTSPALIDTMRFYSTSVISDARESSAFQMGLKQATQGEMIRETVESYHGSVSNLLHIEI